MVNFSPLAAEICWRLCGTPANFTRFASWLRYCSDVAQRRSTKLCTMFGRLLEYYTICTCIHIHSGILPRAKFTLHPSLAFSNIGSVTAWQSSSGRQQKFGHHTRNGITELLQRVPPIFGWATITLGVNKNYRYMTITLSFCL